MRPIAVPTPDEIAVAAGRAAFGVPLVTNVLRGLIVEAMVEKALAPEWVRVSGDCRSWDFARGDERLAVKQAAAIQSWAGKARRDYEVDFDIRARSGRWEDGRWIAERGRAASVYLFAYHAETERDAADHRDATQWRFFVVPTPALPSVGRITLPAVRRLAPELCFGEVRAALGALW